MVNSHYTIKKTVFAIINKYPFYIAYDKIYSRRVSSILNGTGAPTTISIEPFNLCNLKCIMCPYKDMTRGKEEMSMNLFRKIVLDAKNFGMKMVILSFYSEPFLDRHIFDRIAFVKNQGMEVMFYSNGMTLNKEKINIILENPPTKIVFSFDGGTKETYEKIRVNASFDRVVQNIRNLVKERDRRGLKNPIVEVNCTIQKENKNEIGSFEALWSGVVDGYDYGIVDNREGEGHDDGLRVKASQILYPCRRLWNEIIVISSGKVALCCVDFDGKVIVGDMNKQTLEEVWNSPLFKNIRDLHVKNMGDQVALCKGCDKLYRSAQVAWW